MKARKATKELRPLRRSPLGTEGEDWHWHAPHAKTDRLAWEARHNPLPVTASALLVDPPPDVWYKDCHIYFTRGPSGFYRITGGQISGNLRGATMRGYIEHTTLIGDFTGARLPDMLDCTLRGTFDCATLGTLTSCRLFGTFRHIPLLDAPCSTLKGDFSGTTPGDLRKVRILP